MCRAHVVYYSAEKGIDYRTHHKKYYYCTRHFKEEHSKVYDHEMSDLTQHLVNLK